MKVPGFVWLFVCAMSGIFAQADGQPHHSPIALVADPDGKRLYAADATDSAIAEIDTSSARVLRAIRLPGPPTGAALDPSANRLYVTIDTPVDSLAVINLDRDVVDLTLRVGHGPTAPVLSPDGSRIYICDRFDNNIAVIDLRDKRISKLIPLVREPIAATMTADGKWLVVGNQKPDGPATAPYISSVVNLIDVQTQTVSATIRLPNGGVDIRDVVASPDSRYAFVTHVLARNHVPATQLEQGWLNTNALSIIDLRNKSRLSTVLLDQVERGGGNPWGNAVSADGRTLCVALAGVHELEIIELPDLLQKLQTPQHVRDSAAGEQDEFPLQNRPGTDLTFLDGLSRRVHLSGQGPRPVIIRGTQAYVGMYFTGTIETVSLEKPGKEWPIVALGPQGAETEARRGERLFNDATLSFEGWQSCSTCHPDGRSDGLNWDLTNDGIGTARNTKSLLFSWVTPPLTWTGIFPTIEDCVSYELRTILFASRPKEDVSAIVAYLKSLKEIPSPHLQDGHLSSAAQRGYKAFQKAGCGVCHKGEYATAMEEKRVIVSTLNDENRTFDIPSLREAWRTAPYLHDGRAPSIGDIFTKFNPAKLHGKPTNLTPQEFEDLVQYVLSL